MNREELLGRIAQLNVLSRDLWNIANEYDCFREPEMNQLLTETNKKADDLCFEYACHFDDAYVMQFRGGLTKEAPDELSHYDIEDDLVKVYGKEKISADSESGGFFVDVTRDVAGRVQQYLSTKYPHLDFEVYDVMAEEKSKNGIRVSTPFLPNYTNGDPEQYLKDQGLDRLPVEYEVKPRPVKEIAMMMEEVQQIMKRTGLPEIDAFIRLGLKLGMDIDIKIIDKKGKPVQIGTGRG